MKLVKEQKGIYSTVYEGQRWQLINIGAHTNIKLHTSWPGMWEARNLDDRDEVRHAPSLRELQKMIKNSWHICEVWQRPRTRRGREN